ncbi:hypothetical protein HU200_042122 [Digitaria exilis]|uniref:Two-component response regulator n=1 Tax=Digitaria exilis TaxID=1010633 RepID=A0A835EIK7_9POAL|nr:hypothetical protein HU200_042122 [Digitaria exilis]
MDLNNFPEGLRVLAIDGDRTTLLVLKRQLQLCNYNNVTTVTEAETALDMLRERKDRDDQFDLVISDVFIPGMNGFKLLEFIVKEMDIPVIMLSANDEMETMARGIMHGACDYVVKPGCMEQFRNIWTHVVRKNVADPKNNINDGKKLGADHTKKHSKKNKRDVGCPEKAKEGTSTQRKQKIKWSDHLHSKFVEAINQIGIDRAVPKKILEVMNVDGLNKDNIASHLQKYRIHLRKKLSEGTLNRSSPFVDEPQACLSDHSAANVNVPESFQYHQELVQPSPNSVGGSSLSSTFARLSGPSVFGTHNFLQHDMGPVGLPKDSVPVPVQDVSKLVYSSMFSAAASSGSLSSTSQCFPSGPYNSYFANISNGVAFNTSKPFTSDNSVSPTANISNDSSTSAMSTGFPSSSSCNSYASILRGKMLEANRGIPFDTDSFFEEIADAENLQLHSPEMVNQPSILLQSSSYGPLNDIAKESHQLPGLCNPNDSSRVSLPSRFSDICHSAGTSVSSSQGNLSRINQISRFVASSGHVLSFGSGHQDQMAGIQGRTTPILGFSRQEAPFIFGSSTMPIGSSAQGSSSYVRPPMTDLHVGNSVMPTQMLNDRVHLATSLEVVLLISKALVTKGTTATSSLQEQGRHWMGRLTIWIAF